MKKINKTIIQDLEQGRSMVEMLGVLAIIGVLSVAGIAGYTTAMRSYRTNEIVNAASMLYIMAMAQNAGNGPTANVTYESIAGSNPSGASLTYDATAKSITINITDADDCAMVKNKLGDKVSGECSALSVNFEGKATTCHHVNGLEGCFSQDTSAEGYSSYDETTGTYSCVGGAIPMDNGDGSFFCE